MTPKRRTHRLRNTIATLALLAGFVSVSVWIVNQSQTLRYVLSLVNVRSPWKVEINSFTWKPLRSLILIEGISLSDRATEKHILIDKTRIGYRLLGFVRGRLVIDELGLDGVSMELPRRERRAPKPKKHLDIAKLVLLKNVELKAGLIKQLKITFDKEATLATDEVRISMAPTIVGTTRLDTRIDGLMFAKADQRIASASLLSLKVQTRLEHWEDEFPYANDMSGQLRLQDAAIKNLPVEDMEAALTYRDSALNLSKLRISVKGKQLTGKLAANIEDENFNLEIDIPKPLALPHVGGSTTTIDTSGSISGNVRLKGKGLDPSKSTGTGRVQLTYRFDSNPEEPVSLDTNIVFNRGVIRTEKGVARTGGQEFAVEGTINIPGKNMKFAANGRRIPIEHVFLKFTNPHLKRIFGQADFQATFEGWKRKFKVQVKGTVHDGGWQPIVAERAEIELSATYDMLKLTGHIFDGIKNTGNADLTIKYGPKIGSRPRSKYIELAADLKDHPLDRTMEAFNLTGKGTGQIQLSGPHLSFTGQASASIENGRWNGIYFDKVGAKIDLSKPQLVFSQLEFKPQAQPALNLPGQLVMDLPGGHFVLHGQPSPGVTINTTYRYVQKRWIISEISWTGKGQERLIATGSLVAGGPIDLTVKGKIELESIRPLTLRVVEGQGPVDVDLRAHGPSKNPRIYGTLGLNQNRLYMRKMGLALENTTGTLRFDGSKILLEDIQSESGDGRVSITGFAEHQGLKPYATNLSFEASSMTYRFPDGSLILEFDGDLALSGRLPSPLLSGNIVILDGRYVKDFRLIEAIGKKPPPSKPSVEFNPRLDLKIRNTGEMAIRNNVGDIWLNMNVEVKGTREKPLVAGSIVTTEGEVHYLGMRFDITKGFVEFREQYAEPYLEVYAQREINIYNVNLILYGPIDNLALDLSATSPSGPLEKRDVVSLILFGITEQERMAAAERTGGALTTSMVAGAITGAIERPVTKVTKLDVFRLEAEPASESVSRIYMGKQLSDRMTVNLATDINTEDAVQTVIAEYLFTDNLLLKGSRSSDSRYEISGTLRFRLR